MQRTLFLVVALVAAAACEAPVQHTGKRPYGRRRPLSEAGTPAAGEPVAGRDGADGSARTGRETDATTERTGVAGTYVFHRATCDLLAGVARGDRVLFVHAWDALDGGYAPCDACRPLE